MTMPECTKDMREESMKIDRCLGKSVLGRDGASVKGLWQEFVWEVDVTETEG